MPNSTCSQQKYPLTINFNVNRIFGQDFIDICYVPVYTSVHETNKKQDNSQVKQGSANLYIYIYTV